MVFWSWRDGLDSGVTIFLRSHEYRSPIQKIRPNSKKPIVCLSYSQVMMCWWNLLSGKISSPNSTGAGKTSINNFAWNSYRYMYRYSYYYRYGDWAFSGSQKLLMLVFPAPVEFGANIWSPSRYHQYIITRNYERQTFCFVRVRLNFSYRGFGFIRWEKIVTPESTPSLQLQKTTTSPKINIFLSDRF